MKNNWSIPEITRRLQEIKAKGYLSIPPANFRSDEGVVGQILEREFGIQENNLHVGDLGEFELKALRVKSSRLTLCHKTTDTGLSPLQVFGRFSYVRPSKRNPSVVKRKLFMTVSGIKPNSLEFILYPNGANGLDMFYRNEFICGWDLSDRLHKIGQIILVKAQTEGKTNSPAEKFHYTQASLLRNLRNIGDLVTEGAIVVDFAIDQPIDSTRQAHDRGPHIRMPIKKVPIAYTEIVKLMA